MSMHIFNAPGRASAVRDGIGARQRLTAVEVEGDLVASVPTDGDGADRLYPREIGPETVLDVFEARSMRDEDAVPSEPSLRAVEEREAPRVGLAEREHG